MKGKAKNEKQGMKEALVFSQFCAPYFFQSSNRNKFAGCCYFVFFFSCYMRIKHTQYTHNPIFLCVAIWEKVHKVGNPNFTVQPKHKFSLLTNFCTLLFKVLYLSHFLLFCTIFIQNIWENIFYPCLISHFSFSNFVYLFSFSHIATNCRIISHMVACSRSLLTCSIVWFGQCCHIDEYTKLYKINCCGTLVYMPERKKIIIQATLIYGGNEKILLAYFCYKRFYFEKTSIFFTEYLINFLRKYRQIPPSLGKNFQPIAYSTLSLGIKVKLNNYKK